MNFIRKQWRWFVHVRFTRIFRFRSKFFFRLVSNETPEQPVLSPVSGCIFERRLIVKYLQESPTDPINGQPLTEGQLIEVKVNSLGKPKPPSATSIPAILKMLQDEWDASMLHSFTLRQQLQTARQELSHVMYQHDAACRVIARLNKEVTAAREALATLKPQSGLSTTISSETNVSHQSNSNNDVSQNSTSTAEGMTEAIIQKVNLNASINFHLFSFLFFSFSILASRQSNRLDAIA